MSKERTSANHKNETKVGVFNSSFKILMTLFFTRSDVAIPAAANEQRPRHRRDTPPSKEGGKGWQSPSASLCIWNVFDPRLGQCHNILEDACKDQCAVALEAPLYLSRRHLVHSDFIHLPSAGSTIRRPTRPWLSVFILLSLQGHCCCWKKEEFDLTFITE